MLLIFLLPSFRQLNNEQKFLPRMEILRILQNLATNLSHSLSSFFKCKHWPSKHTTFCNQSSKSSTSNFYAELRDFVLVLVQLLQSNLVGHELQQLFSHCIILVPALFPVTNLSCQVKMGTVTSALLSVGSTVHLDFFFHFLYKFCHFYFICISYRK
jgi:hypothetical protein